jgi:CRP-like cAMP-binding protein
MAHRSTHTSRGPRASTKDELDALRRALDAIAPLEPDVHLALASLATTRELDANEHLLRAGDRAEYGALVLEGALREYWPLPDGTERTKGFALDGALVGSLSDLLSSKPSLSAVQALAPSRLLLVPWRGFDALRERSSSLNELARRLAEGLYLRKSEREWELLALDAEARYERFLSRFAGIEARVSQSVVASYLGITPEHLSRVRRRRRAAARATR